MSLNGIDISHYQAGIDAQNIAADFVICKASEGTGYVDPWCDRLYQAAKRGGKQLGVYHFMTSADPIAQANFFVKNITGYIGEAILICDFEAGGLKLGASGAKRFLDRVRDLTGVKPMIYMSKSVCRQFDWSSVVSSDYGLWVAQYANNNRTGYQSNPWTDNKGYGAWSGPAMFQYSSTGKLGGWSGNLDLDVFYGSKEAWKKYAAAPNKPAATEGDNMQPNEVWEYTYNGSDNCFNTLYATKGETDSIAAEVLKNQDVVGDGYSGTLYQRIAWIDHQTRDLANKIDSITSKLDNLTESLGILGLNNLTVDGEVHLKKKEE